jgi:predicted nucleic acid-binding protein
MHGRSLGAVQGADTDPTDALIAACAIARGAAIATRNVRDFARLGVSLVDPWTM